MDGLEHGLMLEGDAYMSYDWYVEARGCAMNCIYANVKTSLPPWVAVVGGAPRRSRMV